MKPSKILKIGLACLLTASLGNAQPPNGAPAQNPASQNAPGTVSGRINTPDPSGAAITLTNTLTNAVQTATTDASGNFSASGLPPGTYRVSVRLKSGAAFQENSITINATSGPQTLTFVTASGAPLGPAAGAGGSTELEGHSSTLQADTVEVSRSYDSTTIRALPIQDRQNQELITLMPGITPPTLAADRITDPQRTRSFNVNGQPAWANLYNQDGVYDTEPYSGRPLRVEPNEAVRSLDVRTSNYNSEYGVAGGSWTSTVTRPGTNGLHGSLFEFNTNSFLQSGRVLNATQSTPQSNTNQFGGTLGGPLIADKMFWFISYEGFLQRGSLEAVATVPTAAFATGNFSSVPGATIYSPFTGVIPGSTRTPFLNNRIPLTQLNPASLRILALLPTANLPGTSNNLVGSTRLLDDTHRMDGKLDHRFSSKSTGSLRYGYTQASIDQGSLLGAAGSPLESGFRAMNAAAMLTHVFSPTVLGELRFGFDRYRNQIVPWGNFSSLDSLAGVGFPNGLPSINITGFSPLGLPANVPSKQVDNVYDGATNWVAHFGINAVKFGLSGRELQVSGISNPFFSGLGSFTFGPGATLASTTSAANLSASALQANALAGFLTGTPNQAGVTNLIGTPGYRQQQYAAYLTDTVNLFQRVTLEFGVRYDLFSPIQPLQSGGAILFDPSSNVTTAVGANGVSSRINRYDLNNVAPRVGLAIHPFNRMVFRAGYGILYFPTPFSLAPLNPLASSVQTGIAGGLGTTSFTTPTIPAATSTAANTPFLTGPRSFATPFIHTYSAMIQGDLGNGFLLDLGYVGNMGRQLPFTVPLAGLPGTGLNSFTGGRTALTYQTAPGTTSNYNSAQVNLTKRFAAGLSLSGAYTFSKALDYGSNLLDPFNRASNYGPADWDRTHVLSVTHDWRLPFGVNRRFVQGGFLGRALGDWELTGIIRWATGTPYSITASPLACACLGVSGVPASFAPGVTVNSSPLSGASSFNPNQFVSPAAGTFGNLSRNAFRGPDMFVYNAAVFRNFAINENTKFELRGEAYNVTNTTNPMNPVSSLTSPGFGTSLGNINGQAGRMFQLAGRILF